MCTRVLVYMYTYHNLEYVIVKFYLLKQIDPDKSIM